ncbi:recombination protein F [Qipengyuania spongiae]|uniref:Recombination protein F n=1 Tax=Qipengyuania spongiae TaxID=2909673 RepID=A0ABY5T5S1_9SPHN|nr:recombination protein F [Qipengyuania spongiae]UVI40686.1 recombination protein F [Qipengyuania spongiae]
MSEFNASKALAAGFSLVLSAIFFATAILPASPNGMLA